jgi:hypothetical protein
LLGALPAQQKITTDAVLVKAAIALAKERL